MKAAETGQPGGGEVGGAVLAAKTLLVGGAPRGAEGLTPCALEAAQKLWPWPGIRRYKAAD